MSGQEPYEWSRSKRVERAKERGKMRHKRDCINHEVQRVRRDGTVREEKKEKGNK